MIESLELVRCQAGLRIERGTVELCCFRAQGSARNRGVTFQTLGPAWIGPVELSGNQFVQSGGGNEARIGKLAIPFVSVTGPAAVIVPHEQAGFERRPIGRELFHKNGADREFEIPVGLDLDLRPLGQGQPSPFVGAVRP